MANRPSGVCSEIRLEYAQQMKALPLGRVWKLPAGQLVELAVK